MKLTKRFLSVLLVVSAIFCFAIPLSVSAEGDSVTLRIEGINKTLYYSKIELGESKTVADIIVSADNASSDITVVGAEAGYITEINGETAGSFGGWDGWLYRVNDIEPAVGMGEYEVKSGDIIVVYYSDAYGVGMQYPVLDASNISNGVLKFTSIDTVYDENFNASVTENPVADMTVTFGETEYITDKNGEIKIDSDKLTAGEHKVSVSKYSENGVPLVLRFAPDVTVNVPEQTENVPTAEEPTIDSPTDTTPGDYSAIILFVIIAIIAAAGAVTVIKIRK